MDLETYLSYLNSGRTVVGNSEIHQFMHAVSQEAIRITAEINGRYHAPAELRKLFSELIGKPVDESFGLFPPFYTDCGKNITVGKHVFINSCCQFQDQGGITIGDGSLIGHSAVITTLNHDFSEKNRSSMHPAPVVIGKNVWLGARVTIVPGVTIGDGAVVGAGAVVTKDVPPRAVVAGVPARVIRMLDEQEPLL